MGNIPNLSESTATGIANARKYFDSLTQQGVAKVLVNDARGDVFYDATIEGIRFQAFAGNDPYVVRKDLGEWCQFGVSSIHLASLINFQDGPKIWMVCKYLPGEGRIDLSPLSDDGRRAFAVTFGVPIGGHHVGQFHGAHAFYACAAFDGLIDWARRRPRKFKAERGVSSYIGDWKSIISGCIAASADAPLPKAEAPRKTSLTGSKSGTAFELPIRLPEGWKAKATPDRTLVILEYWSLGHYVGAVTISEVERTYAFGAGTQDATTSQYTGRNWRVRLYRDAVGSLERLLG